MPPSSHTHRPVIIDGVEYPSIRDAATSLGIPAGKLGKRVRAGEPGHAFVPGHSPEERAAQRKVAEDARAAYHAARKVQQEAERARAGEAKRERVAAERAAQRATRGAEAQAKRAAKLVKREAANQRRAEARQDEWWATEAALFKEPTGRELLAEHVAYPNVRAAAAALGVPEDEVNQRIAQGRPGYVLLVDLHRGYVEPARLREIGDDEADDDEPDAPLPPIYGQRLRLHRTG